MLVVGGLTSRKDTGTEDFVTSLLLRKLTSYIQQLRSFLPDPAKRGEGRQEERRPNEHEENYVSAFIDRALVADWDKLNPKVGMCS